MEISSPPLKKRLLLFFVIFLKTLGKKCALRKSSIVLCFMYLFNSCICLVSYPFLYALAITSLIFFDVLESEEELKIDKELLTTQLAFYKLSV